MTGAYSASKAAVHAYGESLSTELAPFGLRVLLVQPGAHRTHGIPNMFRPANRLASPRSPPITNDASPLSSHTPSPTDEHPTPSPAGIPDYTPLRTHGEARLRAQQNRQPGDAAKAARAIADVVCGERPCPLWLVLGRDAEDDLRQSIEMRLRNLDEWREVTRGTGVDCEEGVVYI